MKAPLAIEEPNGAFAPAVYVAPDGSISPIATDDDGTAPCCCEDQPPGPTFLCWVQMVPCNCPTPTDIVWVGLGRLLVNGEIKGAYQFGGPSSICYKPMGQIYIEAANVPGPIIDQNPTAWFESCDATPCGPPPPSCPCPSGTRQLTITDIPCPGAIPARRYCTRYVLSRVRVRQQTNKTVVEGSCRTVGSALWTMNGYIIYDIVLNQIVTGRVTTTVNANVVATGCPLSGSANITETFTESDLLTIFQIPAPLVKLVNHGSVQGPSAAHPQSIFSIPNIERALTQSESRALAGSSPFDSFFGCPVQGGNSQFVWNYRRQDSGGIYTCVTTINNSSPGQSTVGTTSRELSYEWVFLDQPVLPPGLIGDECPKARIGINCVDPTDEVPYDPALRPSPAHETFVWDGKTYTPTDDETSATPFPVVWQTSPCPPPGGSGFYIATRCSNSGQALNDPETVVYQAVESIGAGSGRVYRTTITAHPRCPDTGSFCVRRTEYQPTTQEAQGPATVGVSHVAGVACGQDGFNCQTCPGDPADPPVIVPGGPAALSGDDLIDSMGWTIDTARAAAGQRGCCDPPA